MNIDFVNGKANLSTRAVPSALLFLHEDSNVYDKSQEYRQILINFKLFVGPDLGPNFLLMVAYVLSRGSLIAMYKIREAAVVSVARRGGNDQ